MQNNMNFTCFDEHEFITDQNTPHFNLLGGLNVNIHVKIFQLNSNYKIIIFDHLIEWGSQNNLYIADSNEVLACGVNFECYGHILVGPLSNQQPILLKNFKSLSTINSVGELIEAHKDNRHQNKHLHRIFVALSHPKHCPVQKALLNID